MEKANPVSEEETREERLDRIKAMSRKPKRANLRIRHGALNRPFSRVRSGVRTGTTPHFKSWMADLKVRSTLQRTRLDTLADQLSGDLAAAFAIIAVNSRIRNVWTLARADVGTLLAIPQIGPARLGTVEKYLKSHDVALDWTAA